MTEILFHHRTDELKAGWFETDYYQESGGIALRLMTSEGPYATLSVCVPTTSRKVLLNPDEFVAKNYSENEGLCEQFVQQGVFQDTGKEVQVGFASCPVYKFLG